MYNIIYTNICQRMNMYIVHIYIFHVYIMPALPLLGRLLRADPALVQFHPRFDGWNAVSNLFTWTGCRQQFVLMDGVPSAIRFDR